MAAIFTPNEALFIADNNFWTVFLVGFFGMLCASMSVVEMRLRLRRDPKSYSNYDRCVVALAATMGAAWVVSSCVMYLLRQRFTAKVI